MGVLNGQPVEASVTNAAFLEKNQDSTGIGEVTLASSTPGAGSQVDSLQREHNSAASFVGKALNSVVTDLPAWVNNDVGTSVDPLFDRTDALTERFNETTGHNHDGTAGNGAPISAADIINTPLRGYVKQGTDILGVTGSSSDVSLAFIGYTPGGSDTVAGVVTDPPWNKVVIRQATGTDQDDVYKDASGNVVYGRLTYALSVWTLSYYVMLSGTETAYSFASSSDVRYYYQETFNPLVAGAPTYSEFAVIPSDNATADVITATTTLQGKVSLATAAQPVSSSSSAGTANASVANADHTHRGVSSVAKSGSSALYGDVTLSASGGITLTQALQDIQIDSPALSSTAPADVGSSAVIGTGTTVARADHVHKGLHSFAKSGDTALYGDVTISASGGVTLTQSLQNVQIDAPALSSTSPSDVASSASIGIGTTSARADHAHRGVFSVHKNGSSQLFGDITFSAGTNITITQSGQDLSIAATGGGGGGALTFYDTESSEIVSGPVARLLNRGAKFAFDPPGAAADNQVVYVDFRVPTSYSAGSPINVKLAVYTPATSGTIAFTLSSYLVRTGTDSYAAPTLSTSTSVSTTAGTANLLKSITALIGPSGSIGAAVSAGDMIRVGIKMNYPTHTVASIVYLVASSTEVTFT